MHDMVKAKGCGLPMWQRPAAHVAKQLEDKMHDAAWLKEAGEGARQLAEQSFDRDKLAGRLIEVLQSAVDGRPQKAAKIAPGNYK